MKKTPLITWLIIATIIGVAVYACSKSDSGYGNNNNNSGSGTEVSIDNMAFSVASLTVSSGTKVTWTNNDGVTHTVTADNGSFDSGNIAPGGTYTHTFSTQGTVNYHCAIHPMMTASVMVN